MKTAIDFAEATRATWPNISAIFHACERELGERIGWPALVYDNEAAGCVQPLGELEDALDLIACLEEDLDNQAQLIEQLRAQLARAHEALGQSVAAMEGARYEMLQYGNETNWPMSMSEDYTDAMKRLADSIVAARAALH